MPQAPPIQARRWDGGFGTVERKVVSDEHSRDDTRCHRDLRIEVNIDERRFADGLVTVV